MPLDRDRVLKPMKKLRKLLARIDADSPPKDVHDLRTNIRRFEALSAALLPGDQKIGDGPGERKAMLKDLGRLRKRAGKVRDMDVLTQIASTIHPRGEEECSVQLLERLGAKRKKQAGKLAAEADSVRRSLRRDLKSSSSVFSEILQERRDGADKDGANDGTAGAAAKAAKMAARLGTPRHLGRENLHPYRLQVKELQNVLRMAADPARPRLIDDLGGVKDAIGEWHDQEELIRIADETLDHKPKCRLRAELKRVAQKKYDRALHLAEQLRKAYLQSKRPAGKGRSAASPGVPRPEVWEATTSLSA
ncbi:MAG TPA: CHAD domain-containing protein [Bryobacteraceae bacterium]|nr:CHAD domain-containing protein [Bryobacteraceae bacterium]